MPGSHDRVAREEVMRNSLLRRWVLVLALGVLLGPSVASASPRIGGSLFVEEGGSTWNWIGEMLAGLHSRVETGKAQCGANADGPSHCPQPKPIPSPKHGCGIDPNGQPYCVP
jgi:hypothetical protein